MENSSANIRNNHEVIPSIVKHVNKDYSEIDILRKAYELILDNSDMFFNELEKSFRIEREKGEFNPQL